MQKIKKEMPTRSYAGEKWITNKTNKKYLAVDFKNRCAYCDDWDQYNGGYEAYHVEHFAPKEKFPDLKYVYDNLLYSCPYCNTSKSDKWPSGSADINVVGDIGFLDPCKEEYYENLHRNDDGSIGYSTELGKYIYNELNMGLKRHKIIFKQTELNELIEKTKKKIDMMKENGQNVMELEKQLLPLLMDFRLCANSVNEKD